MRPRVDWMTRGDDYILEFFSVANIAATPAVVAFNIQFSAGYVRRRMRMLTAAGLLEQVDERKAMYRLTDLGAAYLADDLDADDIGTPDI